MESGLSSGRKKQIFKIGNNRMVMIIIYWDQQQVRNIATGHKLTTTTRIEGGNSCEREEEHAWCVEEIILWFYSEEDGRQMFYGFTYCSQIEQNWTDDRVIRLEGNRRSLIICWTTVCQLKIIVSEKRSAEFTTIRRFQRHGRD